MRSIIIVIASLAIISCSDAIIRTDYQPGTNFSAFRTYAWLPGIPIKTGNPALDDDLLNNRIRNALEYAMHTIGFRRAHPAQADLYLAFYQSLETRIESFPSTFIYSHAYHPWSHGYGYGYGTDIQEFTYNRLYIDLISPASKQTVWRGSAETLYEDYATPEKRELRINNLVLKILQKYPH